MSCHGETNFKANPEGLTWEAFRDQTIDLAAARGDEKFNAYVEGVTPRAWEHVLSENFFTPKAAEARLWKFYQSDVVGQN